MQSNNNKTYFQSGLEVLGDWCKGFGSTNKAHIYTGLGVGGTILTGVWSASSGAKAARKIDRKEHELARPLTWKEKIQLCAGDFVGPAMACAGTCYSTVKSDIVNTQTIAERTAMLVASEKAFEKLQQKTREIVGDKKAKEIEDEVVKDNVVEKIGPVGNIGIWDDAPRCGNGQLFPWVDGYSGIRFWSNEDYIEKCVMKLQLMMSDLAPRGDEFDYYDKKIGIPYSEWLAFINVPKDQWNTNERRDHGWNKGYDKYGADDDPIGYSKRAMEWAPGFAVMVLDWEKDPSDMKLGRIMKANSL